MARRAALMRELSAASETMRPFHTASMTFGLADNSIAIPNEVDEQIENLRLDRDQLVPSPQFIPRDIDFKVVET